ncbi:metallophosphoesterase family protein [Salinibaculum rarum]|uniref:metallophosphoesterase family protein n=1 Tax=Salinibaculum rarum TaxID=3058903 RepID=UPI00265DBF7F|nr:metallophosphoesterase [Salinibaculum sp. KK48]
MVTILHTADTHLGYHQYHLDERAADFRKAFTAVIDAAIDAEVDAVIHSGDLFNDSRPGIPALSHALEELRRLDAAGIPFLLVVGNHDGTRSEQWGDVFETLELATRLSSTGIEIGDTTFYGLDHIERNQRDALAYQYDPPSTPNAALVAHGLFTPIPHGDWDTEELLSRTNVDFDVILAGDDHKPQTHDVGDTGTVLTYPGSTERTAADQRSERGYQLVTFTETDVRIDRHQLDTRDFEYIDVELGDGGGLSRVKRQMEVNTENFPESVVVVTITGGGDRIPSAPLEELGYEHDALKVQINDRRDFSEGDRDYREVSFADPTDAVKERRGELDLSEVALEFEELARDSKEVADANLADVTEDRVDDIIEDADLDEFERPGEPEVMTPETNTDPSTQSTPRDDTETDDGSATDETPPNASRDGNNASQSTQTEESDVQSDSHSDEDKGNSTDSAHDDGVTDDNDDGAGGATNQLSLDDL